MKLAFSPSLNLELNSSLFDRENGGKWKDSNWGPCACEAHVMTTTLQKLAWWSTSSVRCGIFLFSFSVNKTPNACSLPVSISFPEHARSQVKGGHSSGEIELIQACDWLTADSTLVFQREFYACLAIVAKAKYKQSIWNFLSKICYFFTLKSIENN
jgi:hypothetical protein